MSASQNTIRQQKQKQLLRLYHALCVTYKLNKHLSQKTKKKKKKEKRKREDKIEIEIGKLLETYR